MLYNEAKGGVDMGRKALKFVATALAFVVLLAGFYLVVVLGHPQKEDVPAPPAQPLLTASPAARVQSDTELQAVADAFPAPLLAASPGSGLILTEAVACDVAFEGGFARRAELRYTATVGEKTVSLEVCSIYPARAMALVEKGDYRISGVAGLALSGIPTVRMESDTSIRLHAQAADAIYVLTVPKLDGGELAALVRPLQLLAKEAP